MLRLRTFGGLTVEREDGTAAATAGLRRPLALLAMLAAAGPRGVSRDRVVAVFWPESGDEQARNALRQLLFRLRRDVGGSELVIGAAELRLNRAIIGSDVGEFVEALDDGKAERAVALYTGPFLDGVHLPGAGEFERWAEAERGRLQGRARIALETLAADAGRRGDTELAVAWWRRLAELDPLNSHVAKHLIAALADAGDPAGAMQHARLHETLLREELGVAPPPAVRDVVARLRAPPNDRPSQATTPPARPPSPSLPAAANEDGDAVSDTSSRSDVARADEPRAAQDVVFPPPPSTPVSAPAPTSMWATARMAPPGDASEVAPLATARPRDRRWWGHARRVLPLPTAATLVLGTLAALGGAWVARRRGHDATPAATGAATNTIAVFPFAVRGGAAHAYLGEGLADLLYARLDGAGDLRGVDPRALISLAARARRAGGAHDARSTGGTRDRRDTRGPSDDSTALDPEQGRDIAARLGAPRFVLGEVVDAGPAVEVTATLYNGNGTAVAHATADGDPARVTMLADRLAADLLADVYVRPGERQLRTAARTTASFPALRAYLEGEREFRAGRYAVAADAFRRAVAEDTAFALAYYRLSVADEWAPQLGIVEAAEAAVRHRERLSERDRLLAEALLARHRGALDDAARRYRVIVALYPDEIEAWYQLGEIAFHYAPLRGVPIDDARGPLERVLSFQPDDKEALVHLARIAAKDRRLSDLDTIADRLTASGDTAAAADVRTLRAFTAADPAGRRQALAALAELNDEALMTATRHVAVYTEDVAGALELAQLLARPGRSLTYRADAYTTMALLALARGRWQAALAALAAHDGFDAAWAPELRAYLAAQPFVPLSRPDLELAREAVARVDAVRPPHPNPAEQFEMGRDRRLRWYAHGLLSVRLGDEATALDDAAQLERAGGAAAERALLRTLAATVRAEVAHRRGRLAEAVSGLDAARFEESLGALGTVLGTQAYQRFLRATLLREAGDEDGALRWYETMAQTSPYELPYLAPSHLAQAEIYERRGDAARAVEHYRRAVELWRDCDPLFRPVLDDARRRLAGLESPGGARRGIRPRGAALRGVVQRRPATAAFLRTSGADVPTRK